MPIDFNPDGKKTILTVDGGGARGIIPVMSLVKLEEVTEKTCHELFDFVGGTSVGSLIAAGIAHGQLKATEMVELYEAFVGTVLKINYVTFALRRGFRYLYDKKKFRSLLNKYFGDITLGELDKAILITVKDVHRSETIFFVNRGPGADICRDFRLAQVVEASASAPVFFPPLGDAVDGGVGTYGNVCYVATVEAMDYFSREDPDWRDDNVIHLSFGTGLSSNRLRRGKARTWMPWKWPLWIMNEVMDEAGDNNVRFTVRHYGKRIDFRRYQVSLEDKWVKKELGVDIPPGLKSNDLKLGSAAPEEVELMKNIGSAFARGLDFEMTGEELLKNPPPGYGGFPYRPPRLPDLTEEELKAMFAGRYKGRLAKLLKAIAAAWRRKTPNV